AAMVASIAFPPRLSISSPACVAKGWAAETMETRLEASSLGPGSTSAGCIGYFSGAGDCAKRQELNAIRSNVRGIALCNRDLFICIPPGSQRLLSSLHRRRSPGGIQMNRSLLHNAIPRTLLQIAL